MSAITTAAKQRRNARAKPYNKKQAINAFVKKFEHNFDMKDDSIDLREMAKNFNDGPIPVEDIHQAIVTVLGPQYHYIWLRPEWRQLSRLCRRKASKRIL